MKDQTALPIKINILLADDDGDDCLLFKEALNEVSFSTQLTIVNDGVELMQLLNENPNDFFNVLFLDLNMPRKNGFECLEEIHLNKSLNKLPVIIYSTTLEQQTEDLLYKNGATSCICKLNDFSLQINLLQKTLSGLIQSKNSPSNKLN